MRQSVPTIVSVSLPTSEAFTKSMTMFTMPDLKYFSDEQEIIQKLEATYGGKNRDVDNKHLMDVIRNIFHSCKLLKNAAPSVLENADYEMKDDILHTIHKLSWKIKCNWACEKDVDKTVQELLDFLSEFSWDATVVLILATFAMYHGELFLIKQSPDENPIAKILHKLNNPPSIVGSNDEDIILFVEPLKNLVDQMLAVADLLVQFKEQASIQKIELSASVRKVFCIVAYRILQSVVKCIASTMELVKMGDKYKDFHTKIQHIISSCRFTTFQTYLEESKFFELEYNGIFWTFKKADDVVKLLLNIFSAKGNHIRQFDGITKKMKNVNLDKFKGNTVAFFIAEFNVKQEDFTALKETYDRVKEKGFEVLWISVMDQSINWKDELQEDFDKVASEMPWWSLTYPLTSNNSFWWYIKQDWQFQRSPMLVVLDKYAKVIHPNALPMVNYWYEAAFPFSMEIEAKLWREKSPTIINIIKTIKQIPEVKPGEIICVYGSHDLSWWVREFSNFIKLLEGKVAEVKMIYVGTNQGKEKLQRTLVGLESFEKTSVWSEESIHKFWRDLENVAASKMIQSRENMEDAIKNEFATVLSYDDKEDGWALMFNESSKFIFNGKQLNYCRKNSEDWIEKVRTSDDDILKVMDEYLQSKKSDREHCLRLIAPITSSNVLVVDCPECGRAMEKSLVYRCYVK